MSATKFEPAFKPVKVRADDHAAYKVMAAKAGSDMQDFLRVLLDCYKKHGKNVAGKAKGKSL